MVDVLKSLLLSERREKRMVEGTSQAQQEGAPAVDPLLGRTLNDRFRIVSALGAGGMGKVYRAIQLPLERVVAVKVLNPNFPVEKDPAFKRRFMFEASMTARLRHPNTVTVLDYGQTSDGIYFIAMELIDGRTLGELMAQEKTLPWTRAFNIAQQVSRSLREAHNLGVVHRDLKPANVMLVDEDGQDVVKVLDFGLVKSFLDGQDESDVTQAGMFLGSPQYMAPEQARSITDPRSDIYSLGILMYQMLVGRTPFSGKDYLEIIFQHVKELPKRPREAVPLANIPPEVEQVVLKCLEKEPDHRFASMEALLEALRYAARVSSSEGSGIFHARPYGLGATPPPLPNPRPANAEFLQDGVPTQSLPEALPPSAPLFSSQHKRKGGVFPAVRFVGAVVLGFLAVWLLLARVLDHGVSEPLPARAAPVAQPTPEPVPSAPAKIEAPGTPKPVRFHVSSEPSGARVYLDHHEMGVTPTVLELPPGPDGTATAELMFVMAGYPPQSATAGGSGDVVLRQRLQKRVVVRMPSPAPAAVVSPEAAQPHVEPVPLKTAGPAVEKGTPPAPLPVKVAAQPAPPPAAQPAAPPASAAIPGVVSFQYGMTRPTVVDEGRPIVYSREASQARIEGTMVVRCVITLAGAVEHCRSLRAIPLMEQAVLTSVQSRRYKPAEQNGKPLAVDYVMTVRLSAPRR